MKNVYRILGLVLVLTAAAWQAIAQPATIPSDLVASPALKPTLLLKERPPVALSTLAPASIISIFPGNPCWDGSYYMGFQLYYDLGDFQTQNDWAVELSVTLLNGSTEMWTKNLLVQTSDQTFLSTIFHDVPVTCNVNYKLKVVTKNLRGTPPQNNIYVKPLLYKTTDKFDPTVLLMLSASNNGEKSSVSWKEQDPTKPMKGVIAYDLEWVVIEDEIASADNFSGANAAAFAFKEPVRITTAVTTYTHPTHYPNGRIWYRVRSVGYDPQFPTHRILGAWAYVDPLPLSNNQNDINWQRQTVFAEEGKYKTVVTYFDGTLRSRQVQTNLSTSGDTTLVKEVFYDYEGRAALDVMAVPAASTSLKYKPAFNGFVAQDVTVGANTSDMHKTFHYDNDVLINSVMTGSGAGLYYSPNNPLKVFRKNYLPDAEGYVYTQTQYINDGTSRPARVSGLGKTFRMDATGTDDRTTRSYYGSAASEELVRLFGTNVGIDSVHYKKNMIVEPNGQVNITYLDQENRTIATALAGTCPDNVSPLESYTKLPNDNVTVSLASKNKTTDGRNEIVQTILNVVPNTVYNFSYKLDGKAYEIAAGKCVNCVFNLSISITDPDGIPVNINSPVAIPGNESDKPFRYERFNLTADDCNAAETTLSIQFPVTFTEIGNYVVTKVLTPVDKSFDDLKTIAMTDPVVTRSIQDLESSYAVDDGNCDICTSQCSDTEALIDQAIDDTAAADCQNIYQQIVEDLLKQHAQDPNYQVSDTDIQQHQRYCEYTTCISDINGAIFEKHMARVYTWNSGEAQLYVSALPNLIDGTDHSDPYFAVGGSGINARSNMLGRLNAVTVPGIKFDSNNDGVPDASYTGKILEVVDPSNTNFFIDAKGKRTATGYHVLYFDLMSRKSQMTTDDYNAEIAKQRWTYFWSFYTEAKRKVKIDITACVPVKTALQQQDSWPTDKDGIDAWGKANGLTVDALGGKVSDIELEAFVGNIAFNCGQTFVDTEQQLIRDNLRAYFDGNLKNFQRLIYRSDLQTGPLRAINQMLAVKGCSIDYLAQDENIICNTQRTITLTPAVTSDNLIVNPQLQFTGSGCSLFETGCVQGWSKVAGHPTRTLTPEVYLKGSCVTLGTPQARILIEPHYPAGDQRDVIMGTFTESLQPGIMYKLSYSYRDDQTAPGGNFKFFVSSEVGSPYVRYEVNGTCNSETLPGAVYGVTIYPTENATQGLSTTALVFKSSVDSQWHTDIVYFTPLTPVTYFFISPNAGTTSSTGLYFKDFSLTRLSNNTTPLYPPFTICTDYASSPSDYIADWASVIKRCQDSTAVQRESLIAYATDRVIDNAVSQLYQKSTQCLKNATEALSYQYVPKEYHYTLYYFDQAGNLVQTVPPKGVKLLDSDQVKKIMAGSTFVATGHSYITRYKYNSNEQVLWHKTPDAGESQFWYNQKAQVRLSQNAQQAVDKRYSYTRYDRLARIVEVGEMSIASLPGAAQLEDMSFPQPSATQVLTDITRTYYDAPNASIQGTLVQQFLRTRISWVEAFDKDKPESVATYYSYDVHGNVKSILQHIPGLSDKRTDYDYDLISGKVNYVFYQYGAADQFIHRYQYDADNRLVQVYTSADGYIWDKDAEYKYYQQGLLARLVLGDYKVQGLDYYYTLQGWIKGVNMPFANDPGNDGYTGVNLRTGRDVFSYSLGYNENDYKPVSSTIVIADARDKMWASYKGIQGATNTGLYNGNIAWMVTDLKKVGQDKAHRVRGVQAMMYKYDQLNRIVQSRSLTDYRKDTGFAGRTAAAPYDEDYSYDPNGNLLALTRMDKDAALKDNLVYSYYRNTNKLRFTTGTDITYAGEIVPDGKVYHNITVKGTAYVPQGGQAEIRAWNNIDIDPGFAVNKPTDFRAYVLPWNEGAYVYDAVGNLIADDEIKSTIEWTPYGKVRKVTTEQGIVTSFRYDAAGNRVEKKVIQPDNTTTVTNYVRDASGNVITVYRNQLVEEQAIYGSSRIGLYTGRRLKGRVTLGTKQFELSNHLGNVLSVVTDNIRMTPDSTWADVVSANDYYPFGLTMDGRLALPEELQPGHDAVATPGLIARYSMNGNGQDVSGNGRDGTVTGPALIADNLGNANSAYQFDGVDDIVALANTKDGLAFVQNTAVFTITAYVKFNSITARNVILSSLNTTSGKGFTFMYENYDATYGLHQLRFSYTNGLQNGIFIAKGAQNTINDTNWHHVAVVGNGKTVQFYVDGMPDGAPTTVTVYANGSSTRDALIGAIPNATTSALTLPLKGAVDEVNILSVPLSQQEVQNLASRRSVYSGVDDALAAGTGNYRYGFNGKEKEDNFKASMTYDYGFRIYDPKIARFVSVDPLTKSYPMLTPYQFASNNVISAVDLDGLEGCDFRTEAMEKRFLRRQITQEQLNEYYKANALAGLIGLDMYVTRGWITRTVMAYELGNTLDYTFKAERTKDPIKRQEYVTIAGVSATVVLTGYAIEAGMPFASTWLKRFKINTAIQDELLTTEGVMISQDANTVKYLDHIGAEAAYMTSGPNGEPAVIMLRPNASEQAIVEELIHHNQRIKHGEEYFLRNRNQLEVEAQDKLLQIGKEKNWTKEQMDEIGRAREQWQNKLDNESSN